MSDQPVAETSTCTTHNEHNGRTCKHSAGFEPVIPTKNRLLACALGRTAIGVCLFREQSFEILLVAQ